MKSNGYHFVHGGKEIWRATKAEIRAVAKKIADKTGRAISVRDGRRPKKRAATAAPKKLAPARKIVARRNPDPLHYLGVWREQEKGRQARLAYLAATKPTRLAKSRRPRGKSAPMPGSKTIKFRVDVKRGGEEYSFGRPSRAAAETLASQYLAAGYKVKVSEA